MIPVLGTGGCNDLISLNENKSDIGVGLLGVPGKVAEGIVYGL